MIMRNAIKILSTVWVLLAFALTAYGGISQMDR
jgi:hypothetical protein